MTDNAPQCPVIDALRSIPITAMLDVHTPNNLGVDSQHWAIGNVCHAAADRIAELEAALGERTLERDDALRGRSHTNTDLRRIAEEYKTERDGAKRDAMRAFDERNIAFAERDASQARIAELEAALAEREEA